MVNSMSRRTNEVGTSRSSDVIPTRQPTESSVQGTIGTSVLELSKPTPRRLPMTNSAHTVPTAPGRMERSLTMFILPPIPPQTTPPAICKRSRSIAMPGNKYIIIVSLFLDASLFSFFWIQASSEQTAGSLSSVIGVQQTTQCRCESMDIALLERFLFSSFLRLEAASLAS